MINQSLKSNLNEIIKKLHVWKETFTEHIFNQDKARHVGSRNFRPVDVNKQMKQAKLLLLVGIITKLYIDPFLGFLHC